MQPLLAFRPITAKTSLDIWSFGVVLYQLCHTSGMQLLQTDRDDNLDTVNLRRLGSMTTQGILDALDEGVEDDNARDLLSILLHPNPDLRMKSFEEVLAHPFFTFGRGHGTKSTLAQRETNPLIRAALEGNTASCGALLTQLRSPNAPDTATVDNDPTEQESGTDGSYVEFDVNGLARNGRSALHIAAEQIDYGDDAGSSDDFYDICVLILKHSQFAWSAVSREPTDMVAKFIHCRYKKLERDSRSHANVDARRKSRTGLRRLISNNELLDDKCDNSNIVPRTSKMTVLHWAAAHGHIMLCNALGRVANIDATQMLDETGKTPLDYARGCAVGKQEASIRLKEWADLYGTYLQRYKLNPGKPAHQSKTCTVVFATDMKATDHDPRDVALKIMKNEEQFEREIGCRQNKGAKGPLDGKYVVDILRAYVDGIEINIHDDHTTAPALTSFGAVASVIHTAARTLRMGIKKRSETSNTAKAKAVEFCIVMPRADRSLKEALDHERLSGMCLLAIAKCLE